MRDLRGGMDASQYKDYVLVLLFVKYVSDKYAGQPYAPITIPASASFADMVQFKEIIVTSRVIGYLGEALRCADFPPPWFFQTAPATRAQKTCRKYSGWLAISHTALSHGNRNRGHSALGFLSSVDCGLRREESQTVSDM